MIIRDDLKKKYAAAAELRMKKFDEIRKLLAIPPDPRNAEAVEFIAHWLETGQVCVPIELDALGIESDDVANYCFPKMWPADREVRARIIGNWLQTEAEFLT